LSLIKKFNKLNNFSYNSDYYDLICNKRKVGIVHHIVAEDIITNISDISLENKKLYFNATTFQKLSETCKKIAKLLLLKKKLKNLSKEFFSCRETLNGKEFFQLDRSLVEWLGIRGYGVHMLAYTRQDNSYKIWIPKRNKNKLVEPSKLDNTVAGGIKTGENIYDALKREALEEAGIGMSKLKKAKLVGTINYSWKNKLYTVRRDTLYIFDLEVNKNFRPYCLDGEVDEFQLLDWKKVLKLVQDTNKFKNNCALVVANFLVRHGLLNNKNEKHYEEILRL